MPPVQPWGVRPRTRTPRHDRCFDAITIHAVQEGVTTVYLLRPLERVVDVRLVFLGLEAE